MIWELDFEEIIIGRGYDYFLNGNVMDFEIDDETLRGTVKGSEIYDVTIDLSNEDNLEYTCNCPYAEIGHHCKHMAAVMIYFEENYGGLLTPSFDATRHNAGNSIELQNEIFETLEYADIEILKEFMTHLISNDIHLFNQLKRKLHVPLTQEDMKRYKSNINQVFTRYSRYGEYIENQHVNVIASELKEVLKNDIQTLVTDQYYWEAFELSTFLYQHLSKQDIEDSEGILCEIEERCLQLWQEILTSSDEKNQDAMFKWVSDYVRKSTLEDEFDQFLFTNFMDTRFIEPKMDLAKHKMKTFEHHDGEWDKKNQFKRWLNTYMNLLEQNGASRDEIKDFYLQHKDHSSIIETYVDYCVRSQDYDEAITTLEQAKDAHADSRGTVIRHSITLKNLYKQLSREDAYRAELWSLVLEYYPGNLEFFRELKSLYQKEVWVTVREQIFDRLWEGKTLNALFIEEKLTDRLYEHVKQFDLRYLMKYEPYLRTDYSDEILELLDTKLSECATYPSNREVYREMVRILRHMLTYPNGEPCVHDIVRRWHFAYRNRPAMMDELNRLFP